MHIKRDDIKEFEHVKRINLINSITGIKPANLIGTISEAGNTNLAIFSSVIHLGSNPALIGMILRPTAEVRRHTYENILANKIYTINHVHQSVIKNAHYTSAKFDADISEFEACALTEQYIDDFDAPFVKESQLKIGLSYLESIPIKANNTILVIGAVEHILLPSDLLKENGMIDLSEIQSVGIAGLNNYYELTKIDSFPYARVNEIPKF